MVASDAALVSLLNRVVLSLSGTEKTWLLRRCVVARFRLILFLCFRLARWLQTVLTTHSDLELRNSSPEGANNMITNETKKFTPANIALWVLQVLLAAMFLMAGVSKLMGQEMMVENFETIGLGQWFRYVTGGVEVVAAILLVVPKFSWVGAGLLVCTMIGATMAHLTSLGGSAIPTIVLGALAAVVLFGRLKPQTASSVTNQELASQV